jgi:hypothetical protein
MSYMNANGWGFQRSRSCKNVAVGGAKKLVWIHECKKLAKEITRRGGSRNKKKRILFYFLFFRFLKTESRRVQCTWCVETEIFE